MTTGKLLKIGEVARRLKVAVSTIRKYEAAGVVLPIRTSGRHRLFSEDDAEWLNCIRDMISKKGMTLEAINRMIALVPCWELRQCPVEERADCAAYTNDAVPCWLLDTIIHKTSTANCRTCVQYKTVTHCRNMKVMLTQLFESKGY